MFIVDFEQENVSCVSFDITLMFDEYTEPKKKFSSQDIFNKLKQIRTCSQLQSNKIWKTFLCRQNIKLIRD